ncbi:hypothetical protein AHAS_Ahas02G0257200 [Arachis hypogaea]
MPKGMSKLKNLQFLSDYVVGKREENKITELGALADLHRSISIGKLENVVNSSEALEARMSDKDGIDSITLSWSSNEEENTVDSEMERDILDKLRPHTNLKGLFIYGYRGTTFPDCYSEKLVTSVAFMNSQFHGITSLSIEGGYNESVSVKCLPKEDDKIYHGEVYGIMGSSRSLRMPNGNSPGDWRMGVLLQLLPRKWLECHKET